MAERTGSRDWAVTRAGPGHAAVVAALHGATVGGGWSAASVARLLALPGAFALLARRRDAEAPGGFALVLPSGDAAELVAIGVLPADRRAGCARALMAALSRHVAEGGFDKCLLEVAEDNSAARALYTEHGFRQYGRRRNYYRRPAGPAVDALLFVRDVTDDGARM